MTATPFFYALFLLCGLAAAVFGTGIRTRVGIAFASVMFALTARISPDRIPDPVWVGTAVGALALGMLFRPRLTVLQPALAGALAGILSLALRAQGTPTSIAILTAMAIPFTAACLAFRSSAFAPKRMEDEAVLMMGLMGLVTGAAPGIADGWNSAGGMNLMDNKVLAPAIPIWVLALGGISILLGGLFAVWRRS